MGHDVKTKPRVFFPRDTIWRDKARRFGAWQEFLGSKSIFFLAGMSRREILSIFSCHGKKLFWREIGTIWREIKDFGENL